MTAIVTGAAQGIGAAIMRWLSLPGWRPTEQRGRRLVRPAVDCMRATGGGRVVRRAAIRHALRETHTRVRILQDGSA